MRITPFLLVAAISASLPAHALESYVGFGVTSAPDESDVRIAPGVVGETETDTASRIYGGIWIDENFAIEAAYHDFGEQSCCRGISDAGFDLESDGWSVGLLYEYGDAVWAPYTKIGYFTADVEGELITISGPVAVSDSDNGLMFEGGVRWTPNDSFSLRGGYEWFDSESGGDGGYTVTAQISF